MLAKGVCIKTKPASSQLVLTTFLLFDRSSAHFPGPAIFVFFYLKAAFDSVYCAVLRRYLSVKDVRTTEAPSLFTAFFSLGFAMRSSVFYGFHFHLHFSCLCKNSDIDICSSKGMSNADDVMLLS